MLLPKLELLNRLITQKSLRSFASRRSNCTATAMTRTRARTMKFGFMGTAIKPKRTDKVMLRIISEKNICIRNLSFVYSSQVSFRYGSQRKLFSKCHFLQVSKPHSILKISRDLNPGPHDGRHRRILGTRYGNPYPFIYF